MERKIGEIFEIEGQWYQCVRFTTCSGCGFANGGCIADKHLTGDCSGRLDGASVIFKELEKVGDPYFNGQYGKVLQEYKYYIPPVTLDLRIHIIKLGIVGIEIKQHKEDVEDNKLNLKPFDLQKAKEGKPICTRDGRKARIVCFDTKGDPCPIIALVEENGIEAAYHYDKNGQNAYNKSDLDLMMLHEKKSGWANIVIGSDGHPHMGRGIFQSKEAAEDAIKAFSSKLIDTIKIEWYE